MSEFLRALDLLLEELSRRLPSEDWEVLKARLMPLVARYRAGERSVVLDILALLRGYPEARALLAVEMSAAPEPARGVEPTGIEELTRGGFESAAPPAPERAARAAPPPPAPPPLPAAARPAAGAGPSRGTAPPPPPARERPPRTSRAARPHEAGGAPAPARRRVGAASGRAMATRPPRPTAAGAARTAARAAGPTPPARPRKAGPRWILARAFDLSGGERPEDPAVAYRANGEHEVEVMIGAEQASWLVARGPSAKDSIDAMLPAGQTHELSVAFIIPALNVHQMGVLTLPPTGPTPAPATFRFTAPAAGTPVEALINVIHRGRILQTAILSGVAVVDPAAAPAEARLRLRLHIVVPGLGDLDHRETFDAAMVLSRHPGGGATAAAVPDAPPGEAPIVLFDQPGLDGAVTGIRDILERFLDAPDEFDNRLDSPASIDLMRRLAMAGVTLHRVLGRKLLQQLSGRDLVRLQVVQVDPTAFVPVEFVYDLPAPANDAGLCPNWRKALDGQPCSAQHHPVDEVLGDLKVVCPSGFWSVSKVIERQIVREVEAADLDGRRFGIRAAPTARRPRLPSPAEALFAWSARLDNTVPGTSARMLKALKAAIGRASPVKTWREWATRIKQRRPPLLVLLSHTTDDSPPALEIGPEVDDPARAERRSLGQLSDRLVKGSPQDTPVLFLLGCDTAVTDRQLYSFVAGFRDSGAAVVVGTITPVHGELAAAVVKTLVDELVAASKRAPVRFGELMRSARRLLLKEGKLTALSAASFGDADWLVGGRGA